MLHLVITECYNKYNLAWIYQNNMQGSMTIVTVAIFLSFFTHPSLSQLSPEDVEKIDSYMSELMECRQMPGAAIALVKDNEIALTKGYGYANLDQGIPATEETIFNIGSTTKSFTATLLTKMFANDELGLSWDTVVSETAYDIYFYNGYMTNKTMFRDLLSHQTGIARHDAVWGLDAFDNRQEIIQRIRFMEPVGQFRSDLIYNNLMYVLAVHPLEEMMSQTWEDLVKQELLDPLDMTSTTFYDRAADTDYEGFATPYFWDIAGGQPDNLTELPYDIWSGVGLVGPAGSICSTAADMAKWLQFVLNHGALGNGTNIISAADMDRLWYAESAYNADMFTKPSWPVSDSQNGYGLGYFSGYYRGYKTQSHGGDLTGFHSEIFYIPDMNLATFFTTNFGGHTVERQLTHQFLADILLSIEPAINASFVCDFLESVDDDSFELNQMKVKDFVKSNVNEEVLCMLRNLGIDDALIAYFINEGPSLTSNLDRSLSRKISKLLTKIENEHNSLPRQLENYIGTYGAFAYGNLSINVTEECEECLLLNYGNLGTFTLYPTNDTEVFLGINENFVFLITPVRIWGSDDNGNLKFVSPLIFDILDPPIFERDLKMSDAPPPPIDICHF